MTGSSSSSSFFFSSPLSNFLSFFTQSKTPSPPKTSLPNLSRSFKNRDNSLPSLTTEHSSRSSNDIMSVVCPSLSYSNTLFFRSGYNVQVLVDENEPEEKLIGRFRREVMKAGIIQECKRRKFHENKQDEKKRKTREAAKRNRRRRTQFRGSPRDKQDASKSKKEEDDEDNWELPAGSDLPN